MKKRIYLCTIFLVLGFSGCGKTDLDVPDKSKNTEILSRDDKAANSYFYETDSVNLEASAKYYGLEEVIQTEAYLNLYKVYTYDEGDLYHLIVRNVEAPYLNEARLNIYFYVTIDKIYRVWPYVYVEEGEDIDGLLTFYDDDNLLVEILNTDEKIIDNGTVVCQVDDISSDLQDGEYGMHYNIHKEGNQISYSRCDVDINGNPEFYESFVWELGQGLIEYNSGYRAEADILYLTDIHVKII